MSTTKEKMDAIYHSIQVARKRVATLETIKSVSKLHKAQIYELDQHLYAIRLGEKILAENGYAPSTDKQGEK